MIAQSSPKKSFEALSAIGVIGILMMMLVPLPTWLISFLIVLNLALSMTVLLMTTYIKDVLEFSVFPTLLLGLTLFRLALSVASTKLILLQADAGSVLQAFGEVVVKGNAVVGFIVFLILIIVQFIVITKGAERVSEVAARFTLDAMPGKQMGVDAELNAGIINDEQAKTRRSMIQREADFYGAMDGASKFVRGDAIASIIVVIVNIVGGVSIGFMQKSMDWMDIIKTYTILSIGDGLVHQIPALIVSTATGILVTRSGDKATLGQELGSQFSLNPRSLGMTGGILGLLGGIGLFTGLPAFPFLFVSGLTSGLAYVLSKARKEADEKPVKTSDKNLPKTPEDVMPLLNVEALEIELGYGLLYLVDETQGGDLLERVAMVRKQCAKDLGIVVPPVRIRDNGLISNNTYAVKVRGLVVAKGELLPKHYLAMSTGLEERPIEGISTKEPTYGLPALWVKENMKREAEVSGYTVVDNASVIATHLTEIVKSHAHELLGRQEVQALINDLKTKGFTAICDELIPGVLSLGMIQKVLQNLLRERVSIRNLLTILESLGDTAPSTKDIDVLTEYSRASLARQISQQYRDREGVLYCVTFSPETEKVLFQSIQRNDRNAHLILDPAYYDRLVQQISEQLNSPMAAGTPVLLCSPSIRPYLKKQLDRSISNVVVLSYNEVTPDTSAKSIGMISTSQSMPLNNAPEMEKIGVKL
ncbi:MAG: flagellar biosynthesis protein FlhA [Elusimicrobiota bacterium]